MCEQIPPHYTKTKWYEKTRWCTQAEASFGEKNYQIILDLLEEADGYVLLKKEGEMIGLK